MSRKTLAAAPGGGLQFATGTYTGDGAATQAIAGVGFQPKVVIVWEQRAATDFDRWAVKTDQDGLNAKRISLSGSIRNDPDMIISLDVDGFTVGDGTGISNIYNINLQVYSYTCFG